VDIVKQRPFSRSESAFEREMTNLLREKKSTPSSHEGEEARVQVSTLVSRISGQSVQHVDGLIEGLRELLKKLDEESDRLQHDIRSYAAFSQSVVELADIVSEGMTAIKSANTPLENEDVASGGEGAAK
jgi:hypothetical protein